MPEPRTSLMSLEECARLSDHVTLRWLSEQLELLTLWRCELSEQPGALITRKHRELEDHIAWLRQRISALKSADPA